MLNRQTRIDGLAGFFAFKYLHILLYGVKYSNKSMIKQHFFKLTAGNNKKKQRKTLIFF